MKFGSFQPFGWPEMIACSGESPAKWRKASNVTESNPPWPASSLMQRNVMRMPWPVSSDPAMRS